MEKVAAETLPCGHSASEVRVRPSDGWVHCRVCKNQKETLLRRERRSRKSPEQLAKERERAAATQRARRRDPTRREAVLAYDRQRHHDRREQRLEGMRRYDEAARSDGRYHVRKLNVALDAAREALARKPDSCEICGSRRPLVFDHDHDTGLFRGWLCKNCNAGLGQFGDTLEGLRAAVAYLERHYTHR